MRVHYVHTFLMTHVWKLQLLHKVAFNSFQLLQSPNCPGFSLQSAYEHHFQFFYISKLVLGIRAEWKKVRFIAECLNLSDQIIKVKQI